MSDASAPTRPVSVVICALPLITHGLARLIADIPERMKVTAQHKSLSELTKTEADMADGPVILVDLDHQPAWQALEKLIQSGNQRVLIISSSPQPDVRERAILLGARGVLNKEESPDLLFKAIERVAAGEIWMDRDTTGRIFMHLVHGKSGVGKDPIQERVDLLTKRERQVVRVFSGNPNLPGRQLSELLDMSEHTMRNHLTSIYTKLELTNRVDLFAFAQRHAQLL